MNLTSTRFRIDTFLPIALAMCMWFVLFNPWTKGIINFWLGMTAASGVLAVWALGLNKDYNREMFKFETHFPIAGILSAIFLYFIFYLGNILSSWLFEFTSTQVAQVYAVRNQASTWVIGGLLFFWIGPAEEIFWRGFIQHRLSEWLDNWRGWLSASLIYALVHVWSLNLMLILAAGVCGLFWGGLYWRYKSIWPGLISHSIWDTAVFILLPIK